jgi:hypothetical protein
MKIGSAFPSKYLKASDLGENKVLVTIDRVEVADVGSGKKEVKPVLFFRGKDKGLVLNKTNAKKIASILGTDETDEWIGGKVVLYATETEFQGETVDCVRVTAPPKGSAQAKPAPPPPPTADPEGDPYTSTFQVDDDDVPF